MVLTNKSRGSLVANSVKILAGLSKVKGLIGAEGEALYFETRFGIHTFGLAKPIDVIVVSKQGKIVFLRKSLKPFRILFWNPRYKRIFELPPGSLEKSKSEVGDLVELLKS